MGAVAMMLAQGAIGGSTAVTWNPADKSADISLSGGNLVATKGVSNTIRSMRATLGRSTGKYYFEVVITAGAFSGSPFIQIGVATSAMALSGSMNNADGWCIYQQDGTKRHNGVNTAYGSTFTTSDVIAVAIDLASGLMWFAKNNTWQASGDPGAGTGEAFSGISGTIYPAAALYRSDAPAHVVTGKFASADLTYTPPTGFSAWE